MKLRGLSFTLKSEKLRLFFYTPPTPPVSSVTCAEEEHLAPADGKPPPPPLRWDVAEAPAEQLRRNPPPATSCSVLLWDHQASLARWNICSPLSSSWGAFPSPSFLSSIFLSPPHCLHRLHHPPPPPKHTLAGENSEEERLKKSLIVPL